MNLEELEGTFGAVLTPIYYCGIRVAIPKLWKHKIRYETLDHEIDIDLQIDQLANLSQPSKIIYWQCVERTFPPSDTLQILWNMDLKINMSKEELYANFPNFIKDIKLSKLRNFQYRVLTRSLTTNVKCNKWDRNISPYCMFCKSDKETVAHILYLCPKIQKLWR